MSSGSVEVICATDADRSAWSSFVAAAPAAEAAHRWEFQSVLEEVFRQRVLRLAARREGRLLGVLPLVLQRSVVGRFLTSMPYLNYAGVLGHDPEARKALAGRAAELAEELGVDRLEIRGRDGADLPVETWNGKAGYSLALPGTAEELNRAWGAKLRAQVKRPGKEGYVARLAREGGRRLFHPLHARRWHELGSPCLPEGLFERLEAALGDDLEYVIVERQGLVAAAGVLLRNRDTLEMPWASSGAEHDRFGVNMLLYETAILRALDSGARRFDFGRSTPGTGNARFKLQWGALEVPLRWNVRARGRHGHASERGDSRRALVASTWRRLPRFVAARLGPKLAARIPL